MRFKLFTYMKDGSLCTALISAGLIAEDAGEMEREGLDIGAMYIGRGISELTEHGEIDMVGENDHMLDEIFHAGSI